VATYTFRGGVHVEEYKNTNKTPIRRIEPPETVTIPLSQHIGAPAKPIVKIGDTVDKGQLIGAVEDGLGCNVHASVSGTVVDIVEKYSASGDKIQNIVIKNDFEERLSADIKPFEKSLLETSNEEIIEIVKKAGISGMGGASFPTYAKIQSAIGKVKHLIVNCAECEPYITADHRLLCEDAASVINGMKILLKVFGLRSGTIAIEDNKLDAADKVDEIVGESRLIKVRILQTKYPQGDERQLIYALTGIELKPGQLPTDVGCVIFNAETCSAIFNAFSSGIPLVERILTVDGDCIADPSNVMVPIGTSAKWVIECCGGLLYRPEKVIFGGPMMGTAQWDIEAPITKGTSAVIVMSDHFSGAKRYGQPPTCINCGRCVNVCPMHLMPVYLAKLSSAELIDECESNGVMSCVECGSCSYVCPGYVPIVQQIRVAKHKIKQKRKEEAALAGDK